MEETVDEALIVLVLDMLDVVEGLGVALGDPEIDRDLSMDPDGELLIEPVGVLLRDPDIDMELLIELVGVPVAGPELVGELVIVDEADREPVDVDEPDALFEGVVVLLVDDVALGVLVFDELVDSLIEAVGVSD